MKYHIWTEGCQMNVADSQRVGSSLEHLGYTFTETIEEADVIVLNTCVVRQSAEDKALGRLSSLAPLKKKNPNLVINLMGCLVGVRGTEKLKARLPYVDVFSPPSDPGPLISHLTQGEIRSMEDAETTRRFLMMDDELILPVAEQGKLVTAHVPIVYGCSHACTFCIIPYKRGVERSRPVGDIVSEVRSLAKQGVKEITLLGQIVDRYGKDIPDGPNLAALLRIIHDEPGAEGIERIRFLTSHPNYFDDDLIQAIAELPRVMPHIELPIQAGDDEVLANMKRGYTQQNFRDLVEKIRARIPNCSIATDIIVGFPGETDEQFMETYRVLSDLKLDVAHLARYSVREGTVATRRMEDNVSDEEKRRRFHLLEELQEQVVGEINKKYLGETVDVLFEEKVKGRWRGRTPTNKLVFVESEEDLRGKLRPVTVTWTGPWSMQAQLAGVRSQNKPELISL
ncbi:MAG TPA: tRNA (N6-isopentenyl adenosine(37)-C2)-methylthiotransferase MiaB [Anaerolineales bacterium]|nr:tRNA (N6-isopentenyl adenosine(37)-C2)-methylthiotransferase MiaB [Anaerolineales bacterium]HMX20938.1 tRNA (N6-isopentenyl adenosine(37)-C2)-methylthiotransferase MiaB [Anaerolineales bacterium]HMX75138.1 tRNA (N6-isopentenyl adenosine(37)-C2)-methylthiotransferase MiaB [Anaerolineales bacterium]HMZ43837.1 tRNA (N6-isopentenyl adenosine(37)-C2)-methylthiotransferase MiaB [Anaerolineales bacterium]HNA55184.1 tRNA (N6-isopentenyl adenosine(37)-C2)-methylthiotransferase MiaB [Anaerolineales ba